ncbi:Hypothetical protein NTJ_14062 [Nesidiocoris tenuis]|uniref:Uncharacterized protein n=1 Tax=Nesidiocoris tenuis TaxID=355587 RepID=A0ABN7BA47_9HEMI|nr:Hypothetical protein NTJ_14062 [Nesidiocoris tenuis]
MNHPSGAELIDNLLQYDLHNRFEEAATYFTHLEWEVLEQEKAKTIWITIRSRHDWDGVGARETPSREVLICRPHLLRYFLAHFRAPTIVIEVFLSTSLGLRIL